MKAATLLLVLAACANSTGGDLITVPFQAGGTALSTFTTPTGWNVTLDQAVIAAGPFYFNVDPPSTDEFRSGIVIIQATEQTVVDALDPTLHDVTGGANGETGSAVSVEIGLTTPDSTNLADPNASNLTPGFAYVEGTAVKGTVVVPFQGQVVIDQSLVTPSDSLPDLQRIRGADVELAFTSAPQRLELHVDPTHWFDQSEFSEIATTGTWDIDTPGPAATFADQLLEGVKGETTVYTFDLVPAAGATQ
ncbi:MAG TPA: hypothetical protein VGL61_31880 [Kofleriaceae bacterium]|jgi:hypothetical protein